MENGRISQADLLKRCETAALSPQSGKPKWNEKGDFADTMAKMAIKDPIARGANSKGVFTHSNGTTFLVDEIRRRISLGDTGPGQDVLDIPLSTGYTLSVNRDSIGALKECLDLFSPEDIKRIMCAIAAANKFEGELMKNEKEEIERIDAILEKAGDKDAMTALEEMLRLQARGKRVKQEGDNEPLIYRLPNNKAGMAEFPS